MKNEKKHWRKTEVTGRLFDAMKMTIAALKLKVAAQGKRITALEKAGKK